MDEEVARQPVPASGDVVLFLQRPERRAHLPAFWYQPPVVGRVHILVEELSCVYPQNLMRPKLVIAILVLALSADNSGVASMCAAYCMSSVSVHHHMESQPGSTSISDHIHAHHKGAECTECPPKSGNSLNQKADCASLVQVQALKEGFFSLDAPSGAAQVHVADSPGYTLGSACDGERSLAFYASRTIRNSNSASVPLRI
ncbi:MAG TPA: hypothetical protein VN943_04770 [Candidatus Acidoferrum sp.]|nr:hypothetical protein [Candidatus Acidoferrum sp.]